MDGDDAVEVIIDGVVVAGWYGGHGSCTCTTHSGTIKLTAGTHTLEFRHEEVGGGDNYYLRWNGPDSGNVWQIVPAAKFYRTDADKLHPGRRRFDDHRLRGAGTGGGLRGAA